MMSTAKRRSFMCSECGRMFRTADDMYLHAEVCLLDAFETEANAILADPSIGTDPEETGQNTHVAGDFQGIFRPYVEKKPERSLGSSFQSRSYADDVAYSAPSVARKTVGSRTLSSISHHDMAAAVNSEYDDDDFDAPPQLELAEPQAKKYKRIFPIGEDGKQIRPKMECPTCGLVLYRHNFSTHYRIHTGELPFQCSFCDKRFRTSSALTVHTRCHTGDKPYMCPHCEYSCITKRNLDRHIINNHVKRTRRSHMIRGLDGTTTLVRRRGRPPAMASYSAYGGADNDAQTEGLDDVVMQLAMQHDPENQHYSVRRRPKPKIVSSSSNRTDLIDQEGAAEGEEENEEQMDEEEEEVITYHVTQEEMEQLMRAAEAEGVIIQHEDEVEEIPATADDDPDPSANDSSAIINGETNVENSVDSDRQDAVQ